MASILKVDELRGIASAGSITVTGEGGAATQSLHQGLCKSWTYVSGGGSPSIVDSFNTASVTDIAAAQVASNFVNNMSNDDFSATAMPQEEAFIAYIQELVTVNQRNSSRMTTVTHSTVQADTNGRNHTVHGSLA
jgi:hypothetical protein